MPVLHLLRHGILLPNPEHRFVGQRDIPLSEEGRRQALICRQDLACVPLKQVWTSDLTRCRQMTTIIMNKRPVTVYLTAAFREINLGDWEGLTKHEVDTRFPGALAARGRDFWNYVPSEGESFSMLARRVLSELLCRLSALQENDEVLLVAHAGVNRIILMQHMALTIRDFFAIPQPYAACTRLFYSTEELNRLSDFCCSIHADS